MFFVYADATSPMPNEVMFLEGVFVDKIMDFNFSKKYGLRINYHTDTFKEIILYCDTIT